MSRSDLHVGQQFDQVALEYDFMETIFNNNNFFLTHMPKSRGKALDVGCGSGILAEALSSCFREVTGIDISAEMLALAHQRRPLPNITYLCRDAHDLSADERYDYIVSRTTFHHLRDIPTILETLKQMTNPEGRIAILDCVCPVETPPRWSYVLGAYLEFPSNLFSFGFTAARRICRFHRSRSWLDHLATDHYLSAENFIALYKRHLPGCTILKEQSFLGAIWEKQ